MTVHFHGINDQDSIGIKGSDKPRYILRGITPFYDAAGGSVTHKLSKIYTCIIITSQFIPQSQYDSTD